MRKRHIDKPPAPANDQAERVFTVPELARRWRADRHSITQAIRDGRLQAFKLGQRVYRITESEVRRYERQNFQPAVAS